MWSNRLLKKMKRKTVKQGTGTLTISLPQDWIKKFNIQGGDELDVDEDINTLIIRTQVKYEDRRVIESNELEKLVNIWLIRAYQEGATEIKLIGNFGKGRFKRTLDELIGFEIIKQASDHIIIKDLSGTSNEDFDILFRRIMFLIKTILEDSYDALKDNNKQIIQELIDKDQEINKFCSHCIRSLAIKKLPEEKQKYYLLNQMEEMGDVIKDIHNKVLKYDFEVDNKFLETLFQVIYFFTLCHDFYFNPKRKAALDIANMYELLRKRIDQLTEELDGKQLLLIPPLYSLVNKTITLQRACLTKL